MAKFAKGSKKYGGKVHKANTKKPESNRRNE